MKRINMKRSLCLALSVLMLAASGAHAADDATPAYFRDVEVKEGLITADAKVNLRREPNTGAKILERIQPGETVRVLDDSDEDWLKVSYNGEVGYVSRSFVEISTYMSQEAVVIEAPLEASVESLAAPVILAQKESFTLKGVVRSNIPIISVSVEVFNERTLETEMSAAASFEYEEDVREFDLTELDAKLAFRKLTAGEKTLTVTVASSSEQAKVVEQDFYITGTPSKAASMTDDCEISVSTGKKAHLTDGSYSTSWSPSSESDTVSVQIPDGRSAALLTLDWVRAPSSFSVSLLDADGGVISAISEENENQLISFHYDLNAEVRRIVISTPDVQNGLCELSVMEEGRVSPVVQQWEPIEGKVDLMVISAHQDDELLFFGGTIPYYVAQDKEVAVVYMANCSRSRYAEAMAGLWTCGLKNHPLFLNFVDKRLNDYDETVDLWGLETTEAALVELIRKYQPDVIVTHDINGEYGHNQHKFTSAAVRRAVLLAADPESYPDSYNEYGIWDVKKLYIHLYDGNQIFMENYDVPLESLDGLTATQVATIAYSKHVSQQKYYSMEKQGVQYDNRKYGLIRSTVGDDVLKNDLFENIDAGETAAQPAPDGNG